MCYLYVKYMGHISDIIMVIINYLYYSSHELSCWNGSVVYWVRMWWFNFILVGPEGSDKKWLAMVMGVPVEKWNTLVFNSKLFHFLWKHGLAARSAWGKLVGAFGNVESAWWSPSGWKDRSFPTELAEKKMEMRVTQRLMTVPAEAIRSWVNGNSACALEPLASFGERWPELWVSPGCSTLMTPPF